MLQRTQEWFRRVKFNPEHGIALDFGMELWKQDVSRYECADNLRSILKQAGVNSDDDAVLYDATASLLWDTINAAGGIEYAYLRFNNSLDELRQVCTEIVTERKRSLEGSGIVHPSVDATWYALEELLIWSRVLEDRLRRDAVTKGCRTDQGLIPALSHGARKDAIVRARDRLLQGGLSEARNLSCLGLHMQSMQPGSGQAKIRGGQIFLPFPDPVNVRIAHRWQLTYNNGRDAATFADTLWNSVQTFMDDMIKAFEDNVPDRFRRK
jgi:hypothetical protein